MGGALVLERGGGDETAGSGGWGGGWNLKQGLRHGPTGLRGATYHEAREPEVRGCLGTVLHPCAGISRDRTKPSTHTFSLAPAERATKVGYAKHRSREAAAVYDCGRECLSSQVDH